jgi:hypothetical protein
MADLDIEYIHCDGDVLTYYTKGEVNQDDLYQSILNEFGDDVSNYPVSLKWYRKTPCNTGEYEFWVNETEPNARGAFLASSINL